IDDGWWLGTCDGHTGMFPSNYVELIESEPPKPPRGVAEEITVKALYDYDAAENNELSFSEGAIITNVEKTTPDWWQGEINGRIGLFPSNYVEQI
ncbi:hypothetical protein ROZALSC1DRAFT_16559, partial [Rozella allomycis CSF55]